MDLRAEARSMQSDLAELRRKFHREPEIGLDLPHTQERVLEALSSLPLEIELGKSTTSVTAVLRGGRRAQPHPTTVLLRGDMDALPVDEEVEVDFAARNGAMHACGHDLHTAALIGAARILAQHREQLGGDVVFMFQPGEEGWDGAGAMISEGFSRRPGSGPITRMRCTCSRTGSRRGHSSASRERLCLRRTPWTSRSAAQADTGRRRTRRAIPSRPRRRWCSRCRR